MLVLGSFIALGPLTIDMYLPALPTITGELLTTDAAVQLTLTGTLLGLGLGQLVIGPLADRYGRKRPLIAGVAVHVLASVLCIVAPNVAVLGGLRLLQGLGAAAGSVIAMAIVRDLYTGRAAATLLSRLILVMGAAPVLAPTLGSWVLAFTSWRGVFGVLALYSLLLLPVAARALPETLPPERRVTSGVVGTLRTYRHLLRDRTFLGLMFVAGLAMSAVMSYVSGASFVFQEQFGLNQQQFGLAFSSGAIWLILASQLNPVLLRRFEPHQLLLGAIAMAAAAGLLMVAVAVSGVGGLFGVLVPLWLVLLSVGFGLPNAPAVALARHGETAGTAAALLGATQFGVGALISPLVGVLGNDAVAMSTAIAAGLVLSLTVLVLVVRPWRLVDDSEPAPVPAAA
ncbi:DHA1 family bicyclomycin/chloramphenicol resistance-like MFS transporter [Pseudonocardia hierapolitana]|uniref:DHA1 family bicyclomycin/chloramphenicol resistance-like MFS transporter n=1 Tax=Pseudonocardia hierapolitana TaxID=1128676 RepID=A0A561SSF8_9PSEU|nr:Bcr/CflA family efflux MFS transporter [Pseudonocardia hierapolitana]TWF77800.1 DHA1 family bicyclomycin/chloramphenicol resistance-like MFS transporter [Pseudonocardia hierapolitana]